MKSLYTSVKTLSRVALCLLLCGMLLCGALTVSAAPTRKDTAQTLEPAGTVQGHLDGLGTPNWYKITPDVSQYYRFTFYNQSIETRLGVSIADSLLNLFLGKMSIVIYDSYDAILAEGDVKCGYTGSVSLRLEKGQTYYVKLTSTVAGNYRMTTANFADIGANAWSGAEDMLSNGQLISSIDADGDTDWFQFVADEEQSYYRFSLENINGSGNKYFYLYEYVEGAGETPLRDVWNFSVSKGNTGSKDAQLKEGHTYYYRISGSTGGYQLNVSQTLDVAGPDFETAYAIETDTKYTTSFDGEGDVDYFKFTTGDQPAYYHFETELLFSTNGYISFHLYDEAGNEVGGDRTYSINFPVNLDYKLKANTTYYFSLGKDNRDIGNYTVHITTKEDVYPNDLEEAVKIDTDKTITSSFDGTKDVDCFKFITGQVDAYYHFEVDLLFNTSDYICFHLYDELGSEIAYDRTYSVNYPISLDYKLTPETQYYFSVGKDNRDIGNYTVHITTKEDVYPNDLEEAVKIDTDKTITSSFDGTKDVDCFEFITGQVDAYYHFEVDLLFNTSDYICFYLYDESGSEIAYDRTYSVNYPISLDYKLAPETQYYFSVGKDDRDIGNYTVHITTKEDVYPNDLEEAVKIDTDKTITSSFDGTKDVDCFKFITGQVDAYYHFEVDLLFNTSDYICFHLYDELGSEIAYDRTYSVNYPISLDYKLTPETQYYFSVGKDNGDVGKYTVQIATILDGESDSKGGARNVDLNKQITADLATDGDVDWFAFTVDYDGEYRVRFNNETGGNIKAYLYNEYEKEIKYLGFSSGRDEVVSLTAGKYYVKVLRDYGSPKYYTLAVAECGGGHEGKSVYATKATTDRDGVKRTECKYCGAVMKTEKVARLSTVKLTKTTWSCTGKTLTPTIKVTDADGKTVSSSYYTLTTSATGKTPGKYTLTVTFKGKYSGTKKLTYTVALATPKVTAKGDGSSIKVTWNKVPAATTYVVYRRQYVSGKWSGWTKVKTTTATSYTHSGPTAGRYYRYAVKAYRGSAVSEMGSSVSAVKLAKPTSVKAVGKTAGITISWKKVSGAKGYYVYARKQSGSKWGSWSKIKVTTATSYTHKTAAYGANYQYRVCAYYEDSVSAYGTTVSAIRLKAPTGVKSAKSGSAIKTSWKKVTGASGYVVYRRTYNAKTGKYGSWVKIKTTSSLSYTDKSAKKGTYYQYAVTAYKSSHVSDRKSGSKVKR